MLRFGHLELFVADPAASLAFYRDVLGFAVVAVQDERFVWLTSGDTELLLRPASAPTEGPPDYARSRVAFVLYADDLAAELERLAAAGLRPAGDDGEGCPVFRDPDGHWFQVVDPGHG